MRDRQFKIRSLRGGWTQGERDMGYQQKISNLFLEAQLPESSQRDELVRGWAA